MSNRLRLPDLSGYELRGSTPWIAGGLAAIAVTGACAYLAHAVVKKRRVDRVLKEFHETLSIPTPKLKELCGEMLNEVQAGLRGDKSSLLMLPSMVDVLPDGNEKGDVYAVDIGGTNFRVLHVQLSDERGQVAQTNLRDFAIPEEMYSCHINELFDLLALRTVEFITDVRRDAPSDEKPLVGFCFSFPVEQTGLASGSLIKLTKKFENEGAVGADPVLQLAQALERKGMPAHVSVLLNDAVGTFAGGRYMDEDIMIGVILGTGTNACYLEKRSNIRKGRLPDRAYSDGMLINVEWAGFVSSNLPLLEEDRTLDWHSVNVGEAVYEKMVSGLYMGDVARHVLITLIDRGKLLGGKVPEAMREPYTLETRFMAGMHTDRTLFLSQVSADMYALYGVGPWEMTYFERRQIQEVCRLVCLRSARLIAMGIAALLKQMGRDGSDKPAPRTAIVMDGGVATHYPAHKDMIRAGLRDLLGGSAAARIAIETVRESSSMGSAYLAAAVADRTGSRQSSPVKGRGKK